MRRDPAPRMQAATRFRDSLPCAAHVWTAHLSGPSGLVAQNPAWSLATPPSCPCAREGILPRPHRGRRGGVPGLLIRPIECATGAFGGHSVPPFARWPAKLAFLAPAWANWAVTGPFLGRLIDLITSHWWDIRPSGQANSPPLSTSKRWEKKEPGMGFMPFACLGGPRMCVPYKHLPSPSTG